MLYPLPGAKANDGAPAAVVSPGPQKGKSTAMEMAVQGSAQEQPVARLRITPRAELRPRDSPVAARARCRSASCTPGPIRDGPARDGLETVQGAVRRQSRVQKRSSGGAEAVHRRCRGVPEKVKRRQQQ